MTAIKTMDPVYEKMGPEAEKIIRQHLGELLDFQTRKYLSISDEIKKTLNKYSSDMTRDGKISSRSFLLYESIITSSKLWDLIEKQQNIELNPLFGETLNRMVNELIKEFDLVAEWDDYVKRMTLDKIIPRIKNNLNTFYKEQRSRILQRKKITRDYSRNYVLSKVVIEPLGQIEPLFDEYQGTISNLLLALWSSSNIIADKSNRILETDFQLPEEESFYNFDISFEAVEALETTLKSLTTSILDTLSSVILDNWQSLKEQNYKLPPAEKGNKKSYKSMRVFHTLQQKFKSKLSRFKNWHHTHFVLLDDWVLEIEIARLKYHILKHSFDFGGHVRTKYMAPVKDLLAKAEKSLQESITFIENNSTQAGKDVTTELEALRTNTKRKLLLRTVPEVRKVILQSNIPAEIDEFEQAAAQQFTSLSKIRRIKAKPVYNEPTSSGDIDRISPNSLVAFQMMPDFMNEFVSLKQGFTRHLLDVQNKVEEVPEVIDFSLESTLNYIQEKNDTAEGLKIGLEGLVRARKKISDIDLSIDQHFTAEADRLKTGINTLTKHLSEITDNESALQIKFRVTKAIAVEKSRAFRRRIWDYFYHFLPTLRQQYQRLVAFLHESSVKIRKQFTFEDNKGYVSTDVSDYLTETEQAVNKLPFIYQRLFRVEPLTSFELFTERADELEKMNTAYSRWKAGKFAPMVLIGEKGWGKTSLINRFLKLKMINEPVIRLTLDKDLEPEVHYQAILDQTQPGKTEEENENASVGKKIVVLDGLENLFEAKINGFVFINKFLAYISQSNASIFWVVSCHSHAWQYLDKSLAISDYFGYHVKLADLSPEELIKTILRRHNISGYRLLFLHESPKKSLINFKKPSDLGDQDEVRQLYFNRMHKTVKGNLSQAFIYWMRSTAYVSEDTVYIQYMSSEYFNFLGAMSDAKLMILKYIVLHNGLNSEKFAALSRVSEEKSNLHLSQLYDDGILVKKEHIYNINPIIYRQVIDQLYIFNILH